jgi:hypothetical protein
MIFMRQKDKIKRDSCQTHISFLVDSMMPKKLNLVDEKRCNFIEAMMV